jgi:hypothetical protein
MAKRYRRRRKLLQTKAAKAARRRYRAKKASRKRKPAKKIKTRAKRRHKYATNQRRYTGARAFYGRPENDPILVAMHRAGLAADDDPEVLANAERWRRAIAPISQAELRKRYGTKP